MRDTDSDWRAMGEHEPYFGVLMHPRFRVAALTPEAIEEFYASGREQVNRLVDALKRCWPDFSPKHAVDFGCGAGRLSLAMLDHADEVTGIDVAPGMLAAAAKRAESVGRKLNLSHDIPATADWVSSLIVFQHIPPRRGLVFLDQLLAALPIGGFASLQFTLHRVPTLLPALDVNWVRFDGDRAEVVGRDHEENVGMYDYDAGAILARYFGAGLTDPRLIRVEYNGIIAAHFLGRRNH
jgi:SAM-dependent methyltransferase